MEFKYASKFFTGFDLCHDKAEVHRHLMPFEMINNDFSLVDGRSGGKALSLSNSGFVGFTSYTSSHNVRYGMAVRIKSNVNVVLFGVDFTQDTETKLTSSEQLFDKPSYDALCIENGYLCFKTRRFSAEVKTTQLRQFPLNTWEYIELRYSSYSTTKIFWYGQEIYNRSISPASSSKAMMYMASFAEVEIDDFYFELVSSTPNDDPYGSVKVASLPFDTADSNTFQVVGGSDVISAISDDDDLTAIVGDPGNECTLNKNTSQMEIYGVNFFVRGKSEGGAGFLKAELETLPTSGFKKIGDIPLHDELRGHLVRDVTIAKNPTQISLKLQVE
ncbi:hypothetical protein ACWO80_003483 [Vibrio cholerae]